MKKGRVRVIRNERKEKEEHPDLRVLFTLDDGTEFSGGLWCGVDKNGNAIYTGEMKEYIKEIFEE